ncbi:MogA/MoaB family molybdenum cofactor biosynthesis protein [Peribacillus sp. SCS-26]|uniref:MogA/MoaB family molybdenum cofactor biosynthesis protein n=1 Tax=Paraperibacillus marinus TaxID=3115295 RepID=UPI003906B509
MSHIEHKSEAPGHVRCMVVTVSDTRGKEDDKSGQEVIQYLSRAGHAAREYRIVKDDKEEIARAVSEGLAAPGIDAVILNGGTGISKRDVTIETVKEFIEKEITGFGEIFRMLSYQEDIGSPAIMSRAIAGTHGRKAIFSLPGSTGAVRLAMKKLIVPELGHIIRELRK